IHLRPKRLSGRPVVQVNILETVALQQKDYVLVLQILRPEGLNVMIRTPLFQESSDGDQAGIARLTQHFKMSIDEGRMLFHGTLACPGSDAEDVRGLVPQEVWSNRHGPFCRLWYLHPARRHPPPFLLAQSDDVGHRAVLV